LSRVETTKARVPTRKVGRRQVAAPPPQAAQRRHLAKVALAVHPSSRDQARCHNWVKSMNVVYEVAVPTLPGLVSRSFECLLSFSTVCL
jgi:hypothetical protein